MASILSSVFGRTKAYEPSPRCFQYAAPVGGRCFLWGGRVPDFSASGRRKLASTVEIFDPYLETWKQQSTSGVLPLGLYDGACASLLNLDLLYSFGGFDGASCYNSFHTLDPTKLEWNEPQVLNQADGPMRKRGCKMVVYNQDQLALFGGYGFPMGPTRPGVVFTEDTSFTDRRGWSNELHLFNFKEGKWSIPTTTGPGPPPISYFSFTAINGHQAVLFGGRQSDGRVSDCYLIDFVSMEWTKLERPREAPWPVERSAHAACCLNYGHHHPQVLVSGGWDKYNRCLSDTWILDVMSGRWRELTLPKGALPRTGHTVTALSLEPGRTLVTMFGGCPNWEWGKSVDALPKLAETTVLEFESVEIRSSVDGLPTQEWVLVGVTTSERLGSNRRVRKKDSAVQEIKSGRQALEESQALFRRVQDAEARAHDLQMMLEASQYTHQQSLQASQAEQRFLEGALRESQAEKRALEVRAVTTEQRITIVEQSMQEAEDRVRYLQQSVDEANAQIEDLHQRVQDAEHRAEEAERRFCETRQGASEGEPSWVVQRDEINLTDVELGRGGWAVVRVAEFRGVHFAAKCLHRQIVSNYNRLLFIREMNMAARVRHPNLLQFIGATLRGELIILTELMPTSVRRELENERTFSPNQINSISLDVARALNYLHLMQPTPIIHRDISSANILLEPGPNSSWRAKVSDYGSVNLLQRLRTAAPGNPTYAAPEAENTALQSPKMDIFSFGVLLVEMCSGCFPEVADREHLICSIQQPGMVALIQRCLGEDRNSRPSASDLVAELSEPHSV